MGDSDSDSDFDSDDIEKENNSLIDEMFNLKDEKFVNALRYEHFITNHKHILDDYAMSNNIKILIDETNFSKRPQTNE